MSAPAREESFCAKNTIVETTSDVKTITASVSEDLLSLNLVPVKVSGTVFLFSMLRCIYSFSICSDLKAKFKLELLYKILICNVRAVKFKPQL